MSTSSELLDRAVDQLATLPGVGKRTAMRFVLDILRREDPEVYDMTRALIDLKENIKYCQECKNISDQDICSICSDDRRDPTLICVVEDIRDVMAIENTMQFKGRYHVLGGSISPMDGIGPDELNIDSLIERTSDAKVNEVILALSTTMEGDTTSFYIYRKIQNNNVQVSVIARGISIGDELEYADEITLGRSILHRTPYEQALSS